MTGPTNLTEDRDLQDDLALAEAATSGPWTWEDDPPTLYAGRRGGIDGRAGLNLLGRLSPDGNTPANLDFIAAAREGWPHAITRAIEAEAETERLRAVLGRIVRLEGPSAYTQARQALDQH